MENENLEETIKKMGFGGKVYKIEGTDALKIAVFTEKDGERHNFSLAYLVKKVEGSERAMLSRKILESKDGYELFITKAKYVKLWDGDKVHIETEEKLIEDLTFCPVDQSDPKSLPQKKYEICSPERAFEPDRKKFGGGDYPAIEVQ